MPGAPHLTRENVDVAVAMLQGWSSKLTWDLFLKHLAMELGHGHVYSKVAMLKHDPIKQAWNQARRRLAEEAKDVGERSQGRSIVATLRRKLDETREELASARKLNNQLIEQFKRWQYNAERHGLKRSQLDADLNKPSE